MTKPYSLAGWAKKNYFKSTLDEAYQHETYPGKESDRHWSERIPCQGEDCFIGLYSLEPLILKLSTTRPRNARTIWEQIKDTPGARADFHFHSEADLYFSLEALPQVVKLAGARKKRHLSEDHKARLVQIGKAHQFKGKDYGSERRLTTPGQEIFPNRY
jgi:hypothetical protein